MANQQQTETGSTVEQGFTTAIILYTSQMVLPQIISLYPNAATS